MKHVVSRCSGFLLVWMLVISGLLDAQAADSGLALAAGDVTVEARADGYHLFIRHKPAIASVLLSEAFELPDHKLPTYAFRAVGANPINDEEKRLLNGEFLKQPHRSLISSTFKDHPTLGSAFEVVVPRVVEYGYATYPNSRYGKVDVQATLSQPDTPFWFSVRAFAKPYGDYTGDYFETAFELRSFMAQTPQPSSDRYEPGLYEDFSRIGSPYRSAGIDDALGQVKKLVDKPGTSLDMVLVIDTTKSMIQNLKTVKAALLPSIRDTLGRFASVRIGLVFYRDYMEEYLTRSVAFSSDLSQVQKDLDRSAAGGGGDIPEAVVEALWAGLSNFPWAAENRIILLLGDAPQHPSPRGNLTEASVKQKAAEKKVDLQMIMLPQTVF